MRLPKLTVQNGISCRTENSSASSSVVPQGCGLGKKIACAAAVAACAAVCVGSAGTACAACFAGLGMGSCIDCA